MPRLALVWIIEVIWCALASRIRLRMAGLARMISREQTRPGWLARGINCWQRMACRLLDNCRRTCSCWPGGNESTMRSTEVAAELVCSVANTRSEEHTSELQSQFHLV